MIRDSSENVAKSWKEKISLLHIDADHSYKGVCRDIKLWRPFVKKGGYMLFHDYTASEFGVKQAVDEKFKEVRSESGFAIIQI